MRRQCCGYRKQPPQVPQLDLFGEQDPGPQWQQLPLATRSTVTDLMVRLLSEHQRSGGPGVVGEHCDD